MAKGVVVTGDNGVPTALQIGSQSLFQHQAGTFNPAYVAKVGYFAAAGFTACYAVTVQACTQFGNT